MKSDINGRITLAKLQQEFSDCKANGSMRNKDIREDLKDVKNSLSEIKNLLVQGEGKIRRNFLLIQEHSKYHDKRESKTLATAGILATIITVIFSFIIFLFKELR